MNKDHLLEIHILASKKYLVAGVCERGIEVRHSCNTGCQGYVVHTQEPLTPWAFEAFEVCCLVPLNCKDEVNRVNT